MLSNAITKFSRDIYSGSPLTRILPIEISLKNESVEEKTITVKQALPYGVEGFDYSPEPEEGEELKWTLTIPGSSSSVISFWLKFPDQVNTYDMKIEYYEGETLLTEEFLTIEVTQTVSLYLNELILELGSIEAKGKDAQLTRKAVFHLEKIRGRTAHSFIHHLLNLHDSIQAASYLGEVTNTDVSAQRIKAGDILVIMGRRFYESVKTWSEARLSPILELIGK